MPPDDALRRDAPAQSKGAAGEAEGAAYARALLDRIARGTSSPDELATLMQFLHAGSLLHGACAAIYAALSAALRQRGPR